MAILASALLHFVVLGYAHLADAPEVLFPFECEAHPVVMAQLEVIKPEDNPFLDSAEAFNFELVGAPKAVTPELEEPPAEEQVAAIPPKTIPAKPEVAPEPEPEPIPEPEAQELDDPKEAPSKPEETPSLAPVVEDKDPDSAAPDVKSAVANHDATPGESDGASPPGHGDTRAPSAAGSSSAIGTSASKSAASTKGTGSTVNHKKLNHQYGMILFRQINKAKSYPKFARRAGIEGSVLVAITVDRRGTILAVKIRKSSGHITLDDSAIATIREMHRFPVPPNGLTWQRKIFELPMRYTLN